MLRVWDKDCYDVDAVQTTFTGNWDRVLIEAGLAFRDLERRGLYVGSAIDENAKFDTEAIRQALAEVAERTERSIKEIHQILRVALTGKQHSLGTFDNLTLLGLDRVNERLLEAVLMFKYPACPVCHTAIESVEVCAPAQQYGWLEKILYRQSYIQTEFRPCSCIVQGQWKWAGVHV